MLLRNKIGKRLSVHPFLKLTHPPLGKAGVGISLFEHPFLKLTPPPLGRVGVGIRFFGLSLSSPFHTDLPCFRFVHSPYAPTSCISLGHKWD